MINPNDPTSRQRLARAIDFSSQQLKKYNRMRADTVEAYLGIQPDLEMWNWRRTKYREDLPMGNLLQVAGLSHQIALAYGEPQFRVKARTPENYGLAKKLGPALNRMSALLNLGEIHRNVAADSYFGYGIYKVGVGRMPEAAAISTGQEIGPCIWRVGQGDFLFDIRASSWDSIGYAGDLYKIGLEEAIEDYGVENADRLTAFTQTDRLDAPEILPRPSNMYAPERQVWLIDVYFPGAKAVATWPVRIDSFGTVAEEPLQIRDYDGHWSGVYHVLNHLYCPDELVPISQAESVKAIHYLFNDLLHATSDQARNARYHPLFKASQEKDMMRIWDTKDRLPVSVNDSTFAEFNVPGPDASQNAYMLGIYNLFKDFNPTFDEPQRAPTATQGQLIRQTTNAIIAEARRKDTRALQLVGYALGHLLVNDQKIVLPLSESLAPGSRIPIDRTWAPEPRSVKIDDFDVSIEPIPLIYRSPEEKQAKIIQATQIIFDAMERQAAGAPINVEAIIDMFAEDGLPELREIFEPADPLLAAKRSQSQRSSPRMGVGQYDRFNHSERTTGGGLDQAFNQQPQNNGAQQGEG